MYIQYLPKCNIIHGDKFLQLTPDQLNRIKIRMVGWQAKNFVAMVTKKIVDGILRWRSVYPG